MYLEDNKKEKKWKKIKNKFKDPKNKRSKKINEKIGGTEGKF